MRSFAVIVTAALLYCGAGLLPGRVFAPVDIPRDLNAWKGDPNVRVKVSNSLLSDVVTQFIPWDAEERRLLRGGEMPWRNVWAGEGAPLFANPQTALLSPFTWPRLLFGLHGWVICALLRFIAGGLSMVWLARAMGASDEAATISGIVYATSGFGVCWLLYPLANVFAVLPALGAAALQRRPLLVALFAFLATAGGHPETLLFGVIAIACLMRPTLRTSAAALGGFLACGVVLVPFAKIAWLSDARVTRAVLPFRWSALPSLLLPGFLGTPLKNEIDLTALLPLPENFIIRSEAYVGFIVLVAIALAWRELAPLFRRGLAIAAIAFVISLRVIPIRQPVAVEYATVAFVMFAAAAAGPALAGVLRARRLGIALIAGGALLFSIVFMRPLLPRLAHAGIAQLRARGVLHKPAEVYESRLAGYVETGSMTALRRVALPGACWIAAGIALMTGRRRLLAGAAIAELLLFGLGFNPAAEPHLDSPLHGVTSDYFIASNVETFPANLATLYHLRDVASYDVLQSHQRVEALAAAGYDRALHSFHAPNPQLAPLGVRWFIGERGVVEIANVVKPPPAKNVPPEWLLAGVVVSLLGIAIGVGAVISDQ